MLGNWLRKPAGNTAVVFVHGILSNGETAWRHSKGAGWPQLLHNEPRLQSLGIYIYTYQTGINSGNYSLSDVVDDLKERVFKLDNVAESKEIIFVCHSMGGIVVRKLIVERSNDFRQSNINIGLFLVASPSLGSGYANWLEPIAKFAGNKQSEALKFSQSNQWLNDLDKSFMNLKESDDLAIRGKELLEDKFITLPGLIRNQIVKPFSGSRYFGDHYKVPQSDHFSIAKPENSESIQHRLLIQFIEESNSAKKETISNSSTLMPDEAFLQEIRLLIQSDLKKSDLYKKFVIEACDRNFGDSDELHDYLVGQCIDGAFVKVIQSLESAFADSYDSIDENDTDSLKKIYDTAKDVVSKLVLFNIKNEWMQQFRNDSNSIHYDLPKMSFGSVEIVLSLNAQTIPEFNKDPNTSDIHSEKGVYLESGIRSSNVVGDVIKQLYFRVMKQELPSSYDEKQAISKLQTTIQQRKQKKNLKLRKNYFLMIPSALTHSGLEDLDVQKKLKELLPDLALIRVKSEGNEEVFIVEDEALMVAISEFFLTLESYKLK